MDRDESLRAVMLCGRIGAFLGATQGQLVGAFFGIHSRIGALVIMVIASSILGASGAMFGGGVGATTGWLISRVNSRARSTVAVLLGLLLGPLLGYGVMYPLHYFFGPHDPVQATWAIALFAPTGALYGAYLAYIVRVISTPRGPSALVLGLLLGPLLGYTAMSPLLAMSARYGLIAAAMCAFVFVPAGGYLASVILRELRGKPGSMPPA